MSHATLFIVSPRSRGEFRYPVTEQGAKLLRLAIERKGVTYRALAKETGVAFSSLNQLFNGAQHSIEHLPAVCKRLGVPFWRTQPFSRHQARVLDALDRLLAHDSHGTEAAVLMFETYVRGLTGRDEDEELAADDDTVHRRPNPAPTRRS